MNEVLKVFVVILLAGGMFLIAEQRDDLKEEAVKRGYAEWPRDGHFKWKELPPASSTSDRSQE